MELFKTSTQKTAAQIAVELQRNTVNNTLLYLLERVKSTQESMFSNPNATPEEVFAEHGTSGAAFLQIGVELRGFIDKCYLLTGQTPPDLSAYNLPREVTVAGDGTVTVKPLPEVIVNEPIS